MTKIASMSFYAPLLEKAHEVVVFCRVRGGVNFKNWPQTTLLLYVVFHALAGTIFVLRKSGSITAIGFAWPEKEQSIRDRFGDGKSVFCWSKETKPNCVFIAEVIGNRDACRYFLAQAQSHWPTFNKFLTFRDGKLVDLSGDILHRFAGKAHHE